jgi:neutral ceramidase
LQAGVSKVKITPPIPCRRWEGKLLTGIYRDLYARILYLSHNGQQMVLIVCDLLGISRELVCSIRSRVNEFTGIRPETIQIACTHAHSTPDTIGAGYEDAGYLETLVEIIAEGVRAAFLQHQNARLGWGRVPIRGLAQSRRKKLIDGKVFTTRYGVPSTWRVHPELIAGEGEIDPDLTVIRIEDLDGRVLAAVSNFGCHASVALMSTQVSGDFPGEAMHILENVFNGTGIAFLTNGAAGDVDPTLEMPYWGPRTDAMSKHLGTLFAAQVLECLERIEVKEITLLGSIQQPITLQVRESWFQLLEHETDRMQQEFAQGWKLSSSVQRILQERVIQTEIQVLKLGDIFLVGFPGEIFAETGLKLKASVPGRAVIALELTNDDIGYIPPQHTFTEGGYEVAQNLWGRAEPAAADLLLKAAQRLINEISKPADEYILQESY